MRRKHTYGQAAAIDKAVKAMFQAVERQPIPSRLRSVVDQLDDGEAPVRREARGGH